MQYLCKSCLACEAEGGTLCDGRVSLWLLTLSLLSKNLGHSSRDARGNVYKLIRIYHTSAADGQPKSMSWISTGSGEQEIH